MSDSGVAPSRVLSSEEVQLLRRVLLEWGGPARCSDEMAVGMGFGSYRDLLQKCRSLRIELDTDHPIEPVDWARVLLAAEVVFVSDLMGSGVDWATTSGLDDATTVTRLRVIQRKLADTIRPYYGKALRD